MIDYKLLKRIENCIKEYQVKGYDIEYNIGYGMSSPPVLHTITMTINGHTDYMSNLWRVSDYDRAIVELKDIIEKYPGKKQQDTFTYSGKDMDRCTTADKLIGSTIKYTSSKTIKLGVNTIDIESDNVDISNLDL